MNTSYSIHLSLKRSSLLYEIEMDSYLVGETMQTDDYKQRSNIEDVGEVGRVDKITLCMEKSWNELLHKLSPYIGERLCAEVSVDDSFIARESYDVTIRVPVGFSKCHSDVVCNSMHSYLVNRTLFYWFGIVKRDECDRYFNYSEEDIHRLNGYLNHRIGPIRIHQHPF
ncbi:MAG: hypothetical protein RR386_05835 [Bacteroidaceae bacterium]